MIIEGLYTAHTRLPLSAELNTKFKIKDSYFFKLFYVVFLGGANKGFYV